MESKHQTQSVILKLMGLDKLPPQHPVRDKQKVLSEKYLQKIASIGVRKKRSSHQCHSSSMSADEKEESEEAFKVVKTIRRDKHHNPSKGNGKENPYLSGTKVKGVQQQLLDGSKGNLQLLQKTNNGLQKDVHGDAALYETFRLSKSQLNLKDETLNSRIVLKPTPGKGGNGLNCFSFPSCGKNSYLADGLLKEMVCPKSIRLYPEMEDRQKISDHMDFGKQSPRSFSKVSEEVSEEVSIRMRNVANRGLGTDSSSFCNAAFYVLKPASNISVNENQCISLILCSDGSYIGSETKNKPFEQRNVTGKLQEIGQCGQGCTHQPLPTFSGPEYGARNSTYQSGFSNYKVRKNIRCKVDVKNSCARKIPMIRPHDSDFFIADNHSTITKDTMFHKYWGLSKNASSNWSTQKSKIQNINLKDCSKDINLSSSSEKYVSFSSHFNSNHIEENCISLHKLKKRCYGNDLFDKKPMLPQLSSSEASPSPTFIDSQTMLETRLTNDEDENKKIEDSNMSIQDIVSPNSSVDCLLSDVKTEVVGRPQNNPKKQQSESTASFGLLMGDTDSLSHSSYASTQQDASEFQEDSVYSLCSGTELDSLGSFEEAHEPSPISVLDPLFRDDISSSSECLKFVGAGVCDSSEMNDECLGLNVSSDEDCGNESVGDFEEKRDLIGSFRAEESRDFSYVVEVLTEAGISNRSLFTDFSTWHSVEYPISPSVFEILEKKFGEQQFWKRSERRLLFDRINLGLLEILQPCSYIPMWEKSVSRRLNAEPSQDMIEEEIWRLLVAQEKRASKDSADKMLGGEIRWIEFGDDVEVIVRDIVKALVEELTEEIVSLENF